MCISLQVYQLDIHKWSGDSRFQPYFSRYLISFHLFLNTYFKIQWLRQVLPPAFIITKLAAALISPLQFQSQFPIVYSQGYITIPPL